ncbi:lytic transglycosylase domain-containing protein [Paenibacillus silvae]|uniref:lytic transglycosylase domain-containing protein n=2 Tax=Paenibacillus silvae TaxID=1325358 RepID=UPI002005A782|nr:transglycosylase SLT domain-containing protein [Paenibacillus silvae]
MQTWNRVICVWALLICYMIWQDQPPTEKNVKMLSMVERYQQPMSDKLNQQIQAKPLNMVNVAESKNTSHSNRSSDIGAVKDTQSDLLQMIQEYIKAHHEKTISEADLKRYVNWIDQYTKDSKIEPLWIIAMMWQESRMIENSVSSDGAIGLLQIIPSTAKWLGVSKSALYEPETNIKTGIRYMKYLMNKYNGNLRKATIAYNQGEGNVDRGKARNWYYNQVNKHYTKMKKLLEELG